MQRARPIAAEAIERLKAAVGRAGYLDDPADIAPYCTSWRDNWVGRVPLVLRPQSTAGGRGHRAASAPSAASPSSPRAATPG